MESPQFSRLEDLPYPSTPFVSPGINQPPMLGAPQAELSGEEAVIGVHIDGRARAYLVSAFSRPTHHIVNDVVGERPVTIVVCNRNNCRKAFTTANRKTPIDLSLLGWMENRLMFRLEGKHYLQDSPDLPLSVIAFEETTWQEWKDKNPDTDVYVGEP